MKRTKHAHEIAERFRDLLNQSGDSLSDAHMSELELLIEAGIDTALVDKLEKIANKIDAMAHSVRNDAELFSS